MPNSRGTLHALKNEFGIKTDYILIKNTTDIQAIKKLKLEPVNDQIDFNKFTFVNVAAFRSEKNHSLLIDAVAQLKDRDFQLLLIGKGRLLEPIKEKVKTLGLENKIIFMPFTDNPFKYLYRSNCFLLSSLTEGFPNILIESMTCKLPIIAADCKTGPRELLAPDSDLDTIIPINEFEIAPYGLLAASNSRDSLVAAMKWALDHPGKLKEFGENTEGKTAEFDFRKVTQELSLAMDKYLNNTQEKPAAKTIARVTENRSIA
jgi:N-acetylgalactosamine-N,N'-diacetylbacillosaminyl-diphospho-undecaprenol 4-alpha-N-acetylgalactosaminyltransferase